MKHRLTLAKHKVVLEETRDSFCTIFFWMFKVIIYSMHTYTDIQTQIVGPAQENDAPRSSQLFNQALPHACSPITPQMLSGKPTQSNAVADTSSKLNNSPCFHLPILPSANLKAFYTLRLLRQRSNKRCCQLTRWKNILLIFSLPSSLPSSARSLDVPRRGLDHSLPGGSLTQDRLPLT